MCGGWWMRDSDRGSCLDRIRWFGRMRLEGRLKASSRRHFLMNNRSATFSTTMLLDSYDSRRSNPKLTKETHMGDPTNFPPTMRVGILVYEGFEPIDVWGFTEAFAISRFLGTGYLNAPAYPFEVLFISNEN